MSSLPEYATWGKSKVQLRNARAVFPNRFTRARRAIYYLLLLNRLAREFQPRESIGIHIAVAEAASDTVLRRSYGMELTGPAIVGD